jgi:hypothetical protein
MFEAVTEVFSGVELISVIRAVGQDGVNDQVAYLPAGKPLTKRLGHPVCHVRRIPSAAWAKVESAADAVPLLVSQSRRRR